MFFVFVIKIYSNVETLPIFTRHLKDIRCCDGDSIRFECHFDGQPEPAIIWEKDGRVLSQCTDFVANVIDGRATLTIRRIYPEDEGEYTCVATNNIGRAFTSACIVVDGKLKRIAYTNIVRYVNLYLVFFFCSSSLKKKKVPKKTKI